MKIAFVDTETTGLNFGLGGDGSNTDDMIECCVIVWNDGEIEREFTQKFYPTGPISAGALHVNGYDSGKWHAAGAVQWSANAAGVFAGLIDGCDMLGGAATAFDRDVLKSSFRKVRAVFPEKTHRLLDVQSLAIPLLLAGKIDGVSLAKIAKFYGVDTSQAHTARGDVLMTIAVFERLMQDFWPGAMSATGGAVAA